MKSGQATASHHRCWPWPSSRLEHVCSRRQHGRQRQEDSYANSRDEGIDVESALERRSILCEPQSQTLHILHTQHKEDDQFTNVIEHRLSEAISRALTSEADDEAVDHTSRTRKVEEEQQSRPEPVTIRQCNNPECAVECSHTTSIICGEHTASEALTVRPYNRRPTTLQAHDAFRDQRDSTMARLASAQITTTSQQTVQYAAEGRPRHASSQHAEVHVVKRGDRHRYGQRGIVRHGCYPKSSSWSEHEFNNIGDCSRDQPAKHTCVRTGCNSE